MNKKLIISFILVLCILLSSFISCTKDAANDNDDTLISTPAIESETTSGEVTEIIPALPEKDMEGFELRILNYNNDWMIWCSTEFDTEEMVGDLVGDAIYVRNRSIEEQYGCIINVSLTSQVENSGMRNSINAGDSDYDIYMLYDSYLTSYMDICRDWHDVPCISFDTPWWLPNAMDTLNIGGIQFALTGSITLAPYSRAMCIVYNKDIYSELGESKTPYEYVENNEWTIDNLLTIGKKAVLDMNGDGNYDENDRYGYFSNYKDFIANLSSGCGISWVERDSEGDFVFNAPSNEKVLSLVMKLAEEWERKEFTFGNGPTVHDGSPKNFFELGHSLFAIGNPFFVEECRQMDADIGVVPLAKYDSSQTEYYAPSSGVAVAILPKSVREDRLENMGIILESLSYSTYRDVVPVYIDLAISTKAARDEESGHMFNVIFDAVKFDPGLTMLFDLFAATFIGDIYEKGATVLSSSIESSRNSINDQISKIQKYAKEYQR